MRDQFPQDLEASIVLQSRKSGQPLTHSNHTNRKLRDTRMSGIADTADETEARSRFFARAASRKLESLRDGLIYPPCCWKALHEEGTAMAHQPLPLLSSRPPSPNWHCGSHSLKDGNHYQPIDLVLELPM